jgi:uncharacterized membrane protein YraQ (UPF0718 family)
MKRWYLSLGAVLLLISTLLWDPQITLKASHLVGDSFVRVLVVMPPIFILIGLLDAWVPRETMTRFMGESSGFLGFALAFFLGSAAAGPLYAAFPVAAVLLQKGARPQTILVFIGAWSTTKLPLVMFELSALGPAFTFTRLGMNILIISLIAFLIPRLVSPQDLNALRERAGSL